MRRIASGGASLLLVPQTMGFSWLKADPQESKRIRKNLIPAEVKVEPFITVLGDVFRIIPSFGTMLIDTTL